MLLIIDFREGELFIFYSTYPIMLSMRHIIEGFWTVSMVGC